MASHFWAALWVAPCKSLCKNNKDLDPNVGMRDHIWYKVSSWLDGKLFFCVNCPVQVFRFWNLCARNAQDWCFWRLIWSEIACFHRGLIEFVHNDGCNWAPVHTGMLLFSGHYINGTFSNCFVYDCSDAGLPRTSTVCSYFVMVTSS